MYASGNQICKFLSLYSHLATTKLCRKKLSWKNYHFDYISMWFLFSIKSQITYSIGYTAYLFYNFNISIFWPGQPKPPIVGAWVSASFIWVTAAAAPSRVGGYWLLQEHNWYKGRVSQIEDKNENHISNLQAKMQE